jgi:hypothetical protein
MACSQCGAPLEFAEGRPLACHYCGQVQANPSSEGDGHVGPVRVYVTGGQTYGSVEEMPAHARSDFEGALETHSTAPPPSYVPSGRSSIAGKIILVAAVVLGGAVVLSIVASSSSGPRHHHPSLHHHGR